MNAAGPTRTVATVKGLVMAGGYSRRMGRDKALLCYHDVPQALWTHRLLKQVCTEVWIGCRHGQDLGPANNLPRICDRKPDRGPTEGITAALAHDPAAAWLVVACDLPRLNLAALDHLLRERDPAALATAYRSAHDGLPEPLCAIYEPRMLPLLEAALDQPRNCPRKVLVEAGERVRLLVARNDGAMDNFNTPDEAASLQKPFPYPPNVKKTIHLQYFAILREQAGCARETLGTEAPDATALYHEVATKHGFTLGAAQIRVAIDNEYQPMDKPLADGMLLTFVPPVAGG